MKRIYLDNASTSCPKPPAVLEAMITYARACGTSGGRGAYAEAKACEEMIRTCRDRIARLLHAEGLDRIVFAMNCSEALAIAIRGLLNTAPPGTHAIATAMEHNSVLRPFNALAEQVGLVPEFIPCDDRTGLVDPADVRGVIRRQTRLIACSYVSNVTGTIQPVVEIARIARERGVPCLVDAAQAVGHVEVDVQEIGADFVAFPGHKGLLGSLGTGGLYVRPGAEALLKTMKEGGTGTKSEFAFQPSTMPDKFEIGSPNAIGIAGLSEAMAWLLEHVVGAVREHDEKLCRLFLELTDPLEDVTVYGPWEVALRSGVFSVNVDGLTPLELAGRLEKDFGILTRPGLHCAPLAHKTIGTYPAGTCRLSFGPFTTEEDVRRAAEALSRIAERDTVSQEAPYGGRNPRNL